METVWDFIFGGSKITSDGYYSHEIKRYLLLGKKVRTNLDCMLKSRDITLPTKVHLVKAMYFPVVMYGCESWTMKIADCWRIDASPMDWSMPGLPVLHHCPALAQTHVHWVSDAILSSCPLSSPSPAFNPFQHQDLFKWVSSSHQVAKVLEFQLQHQSFQWTSRTDLL